MKLEFIHSKKDILEVALFFYEELLNVPEYITSGEVKFNRSDDGHTWNQSLYKKIEADFLYVGKNNSPDHLIKAANHDGTIIGALYISCVKSRKRTYYILEDLMVSHNERQKGLAGKILFFAEAFITNEGGGWVFSEVGARNEVARTFFESNGYNFISSVHGKIL